MNISEYVRSEIYFDNERTKNARALRDIREQKAAATIFEYLVRLDLALGLIEDIDVWAAEVTNLVGESDTPCGSYHFCITIEARPGDIAVKYVHAKFYIDMAGRAEYFSWDTTHQWGIGTPTHNSDEKYIDWLGAAKALINMETQNEPVRNDSQRN